MKIQFQPTRAAGLARLDAFRPRMSRAYAEGRNTDAGLHAEQHVSMLSPYLRRRLATEAEVLRVADGGAGVFVTQLMWRAYFKGYLEQHPAIWPAYLQDVARARDRLAAEGGLRHIYHDATEGDTGIECFDAWAKELVQANWLHNHARLWFASIWIFTLGLPWSLGADFFLRHLLDGDPASNTLSWRWVAGLHTRGKHYVARAENIRAFTNGRYCPTGQLDEAPEPLVENAEFPLIPLPSAPLIPSGPVSLLLTDDDLAPETLDFGSADIRAVALVSNAEAIASHGLATPVAFFIDAALEDASRRTAARFGVEPVRLRLADLPAWIAAASTPVVTVQPPVGPNADLLAPFDLIRLRRPFDELAWPHATRGFFAMRKVLPGLIDALTRAA